LGSRLTGGLCGRLRGRLRGRRRGWIMFVELWKGDRVRVIDKIFLDFENPFLGACNPVLKLGCRSMRGHRAIGNSCFTLTTNIPPVYHIAHIMPFAFGQGERFIAPRERRENANADGLSSVVFVKNPFFLFNGFNTCTPHRIDIVENKI
jgi:hypothetical protein